jgi:hypothetical protein
MVAGGRVARSDRLGNVGVSKADGEDLGSKRLVAERRVTQRG